MSDFDPRPEYKELGSISQFVDVKRCPMCRHRVLRKYKRPDGRVVVKCQIHLCGVEGPPRSGGLKAVEAWNIRATDKTMTVGRLGVKRK